MKIEKPLLHKIAHLARLEIDADKERALLDGLNKIVLWTQQLEEVDTTGVLPLVTMSPEQDVFDEDVPQAPLAHDAALANAPCKDSNYFRVPQVNAS